MCWTPWDSDYHVSLGSPALVCVTISPGLGGYLYINMTEHLWFWKTFNLLKRTRDSIKGVCSTTGFLGLLLLWFLFNARSNWNVHSVSKMVLGGGPSLFFISNISCLLFLALYGFFLLTPKPSFKTLQVDFLFSFCQLFQRGQRQGDGVGPGMRRLLKKHHPFRSNIDLVI